MLADGNYRGWHFTRLLLLNLHGEFLFQGFCGYSVWVTVYREVLYWGQTLLCFFLCEETLKQEGDNTKLKSCSLNINYEFQFMEWVVFLSPAFLLLHPGLGLTVAVFQKFIKRKMSRNTK